MTETKDLNTSAHIFHSQLIFPMRWGRKRALPNSFLLLLTCHGELLDVAYLISNYVTLLPQPHCTLRKAATWQVYPWYKFKGIVYWEKKRESFVIIYSPSFCSKPMCCCCLVFLFFYFFLGGGGGGGCHKLKQKLQLLCCSCNASITRYSPAPKSKKV